MSFMGYVISLVSFAGAVLLMKPIEGFITPYMSTFTWAALPATYIIAWLLATQAFPRILIFLYGLMNK